MKLVVGLDLGTSNCAWATAEARAGACPEHLQISQWVEGRRKSSNVLLPSVLYSPRESELFEGSSSTWIAGQYARQRAQETVGRGIYSAKSWLCHTGVDRLKPLLPWASEASDALARLSPVAASQKFLEHLRDEFLSTHPQARLQDTRIVLTVPASFDPIARQLTVQAATNAGLAVSLLEEPQAAFYDYLDRQPSEVEGLLSAKSHATVLVCDLGGGTLDLSLIQITRKSGQIVASRRAVGRHLLLGGDNMDLAIAHWVAPRITESELSPRRMGQLVAACRHAKEQLLGSHPPESVAVQLLSEGAQLLGGALSMQLQRTDVEKLILDGFFPFVDPTHSLPFKKVGLASAGLPYERDAAVTRHISEFLKLHRDVEVPSALLLNGGTASSPVIVSRLQDVLQQLQGKSIVCLPGASPELAVSRGAALHGLSLLGYGQRIEGGAARGLYIGIGTGRSGARERAVCVIPRGAREEVRHVATGANFELALGVEARFEVYASSIAKHEPGQIVNINEHGITSLSSLTTTVSHSETGKPTLSVQLEGELTAIGTLALFCATSNEPSTSHRLEFELASRVESSVPGTLPPLAEQLLQRVYGKKAQAIETREVKDLIRNLEKLLGLRKTWTAQCGRAVVDCLLPLRKSRLRSEEHERNFWMLTSFCLRPGYGMVGDEKRIDLLWPLFSEAIKFRKVETNWQQYWIAWRRLAGGLSVERQTSIWSLLAPLVAPAEANLAVRKGFKPLAVSEVLSLVSQLERLPARERVSLGNWIVELTWSQRDARLWQCLSAVGARVPSYGSLDGCVDRKVVARWMEQLLMEQWKDVPTAGSCALALCRVTGDEQHDLSLALRQKVALTLKSAGFDAEMSQAVLQYVRLSVAARSEQQGDALPPGLTLSD